MFVLCVDGHLRGEAFRLAFRHDEDGASIKRQGDVGEHIVPGTYPSFAAAPVFAVQRFHIEGGGRSFGLETDEIHRVLIRDAGGHRDEASHLQRPVQQVAGEGGFFHQEVGGLSFRQRLAGRVVDHHEFRRVFVDREGFQFDGKRKFDQAAGFIRRTPFGGSFGHGHTQSSQVTVPQDRRPERDEQAGMVQGEGDVFRPETGQPAQGHQSQDRQHIEEQEHERPRGGHLVEPQAGDQSSGKRFCRGHLRREPHQND